MDLSERQLQILQAIITDYVENAEPVGSRSIAKKYDLGVSPATIRNEMSDLEEIFRICKTIKYHFTTWANALIVTSLKRQSLGLQIIIKQYQDYI